VTDPLTGRPVRPRVEGTGRLEAFSDGVIAIVVTLLVLELRLPDVEGHSNVAFLEAFGAVMPKFISFAVSFAIVAIFWVNHHHFVSRVTHTD
jgi:TMEM175 potassium channel family protein